jgi:predicted MFS family arabinose efflux permease
MLLLVFLALAATAVPITGGRLRALADVRFRGLWLLWLALGVQLTLTFLPGTESDIRVAGHVATYPLGIGFIWMNRRIPGLWLVAVGALMNLAAIAANGGVIPAAPHALAVAGLPADPGVYSNSIALAAPKLLFLGDIFAIPSSWPFSNVFSAGDICIALGGAVAIHRLAGSRLAPSGAGQFTHALRHGGFVRLWGAQAVSNLGDWIYALAVAATLSTRAGGAELARTLSILLICRFAPAALMGALFSGPLADRHSRRNLMVFADVARAVAVASLLLSPSPSLLHFYAVAACLGLFGSVFQPSLMASVPNVVGEGEVVAANALVGATCHFAVMTGAVLGAFLVSALGARWVFGMNAASFTVSAILILGVRMPRSARGGAETNSPLRDLVEGGRYVLSTPLVRGVLLVMGIVLMAAATKTPLETPFVRDVLTEGTSFAARTRVLAFVTTAWGLGMLLGSFSSPALARRWHRERLLPIAIGVVGVAVLLVSRTTDFATALFAWLVAGAAYSVGNVSYGSLLQERTPDTLRGRVFAATEAVLDASYLAGAFLAGVLGSVFHVSGAFAVSGGMLLCAASLAPLLLPRPTRRKDRALGTGTPARS